MILQKILMVSFQMYIVFFGDRVISQIIFGDVLPEMVGNMQLRQVSKILKAYPTSMRNRSNCKAFRTFMNNPQTKNLSKLLYFTGRLVEFRYFKFEIRLGRRNHEIRSEVVLSYVYKQLKI